MPDVGGDNGVPEGAGAPTCEQVTLGDETYTPDGPACPISFYPQPCNRMAGSGCNRCQVVCPTGAISFETADSAPAIDPGACNGCGVCVGICDSFEPRDITTYDLARRLERLGKRHGRIVLCCSEDAFEGLEPAPEVAVLPCLACLSPELTSFLLARGCAVRVAHDDAYCEGCLRGGPLAGKLWRRSLELASEWSGATPEFLREIPERTGHLQQIAHTDRRGLFTGIFDAALDVASGNYRERKSTVAEQFMQRREQARARLQSHEAQPLFPDDEARASWEEGHFTRKRLMREAGLAGGSLD